MRSSTLGGLAKTGVDDWVANDPKGKVNTVPIVPIIHPTYPDSASASGSITKAAAFKKLCTDWNAALTTLKPLVTPDEVRPLKLYGDTITDEEKTVIPAVDLPPGLPRFMLESPKTWAARLGETTDKKRGSITITIPKGFRRLAGHPRLTDPCSFCEAERTLTRAFCITEGHDLDRPLDRRCNPIPIVGRNGQPTPTGGHRFGSACSGAPSRAQWTGREVRAGRTLPGSPIRSINATITARIAVISIPDR